MEIPYNPELTYIAKTNFRSTNQVFGIKRKDRRQHMYVLGKSGTGKSVLLANMIIQNIKNGEGVCVVDPHGELVEEVLHSIPPERVKDVVYFNPADNDFSVGFNVLDLDDPKYKHLVASGIMGIFTKIWANAWSSRMEYILNNAILALLDTPGSTLLGIPRILVDKDYRQVIINNLKDPVVKAFWIHEYEAWRDQFRNEAIAPIQNKVGQFLSTSIIRNIVGQSKSTIDIFDIMNSGKIFLVNVSKGRIGEDNSALLGGMIITKLQLSAMERVRIPENERKDFYLYVDEFQNFVTDSFANILSEARKYRLNLTVAHQYTAQLVTPTSSQVRDAVFGNVGTMIIFRVGADDAAFLEKEFEPEFTPEDIVNLPNYHIYLKLMVDGITSRPFSATTLPPIKIDAAKEVAKQVEDMSRKLYARPRDVVEREIQQWSSMLPGSPNMNSDGRDAAPIEGKFKATCSSCGDSIYVPFEPEEGRPVYCKNCLMKIKNGELEPAKGFKAPREKKEAVAVYSALSSLGIEYADTGGDGSGMPPRKEAKAPSTSNDRPFGGSSAPQAARSADRSTREPEGDGTLKSMLGNAIGQAMRATDPRNQSANTPKPTLSLDELRKKQASPASTISPTKDPKKEPSGERLSALRDVLAKVQKTPGEEKPAVSETVTKAPVVEETPPPAPVAKAPEPVAVPTPSEPVVPSGPSEEEIRMRKEVEEERKKLAEEKERLLQLEKEAREKENQIKASQVELEKKLQEEQRERERIAKEKDEALAKAQAESKIRADEQDAKLRALTEEKAKIATLAEEERLRAEKESEARIRALEEEKERAIKEAEVRSQEELKRRMEEVTTAQAATPNHAKKELPEDILKSILE